MSPWKEIIRYLKNLDMDSIGVILEHLRDVEEQGIPYCLEVGHI
jgi:hypothetical protein